MGIFTTNQVFLNELIQIIEESTKDTRQTSKLSVAYPFLFIVICTFWCSEECQICVDWK